MTPLFTIGYEKATSAAVMKELIDAKIELLVDVRAITASRRPGFSKRALSSALDEAGIRYLHLQRLGTPAAGRKAAHSGDLSTLWNVYESHLKKPEAKAALDALVDLVKSGKRIALLCYCRNPKACHRARIIAHIKKRTGAEVQDLIPPLF